MSSIFKKFSLLLCGFLVSLNVHAAAKDDLKARLNAFNEFSADFTQTVTDKNGKNVMSASGTLTLKKPTDFMLHTLDPDEQVLFTRGNDIYFYDAFVNQVSIFNRSELNSSPFILLSDMSERAWKNYTVTYTNGAFIVTPQGSSDIENLRLTFQRNNLDVIALKMKDGNTNSYKLSNKRHTADPKVFNYTIPEDAEVDDER